MNLHQYQKKVNQLVKNWEKIRSKALENTKEVALDLIAEDQLYNKGIDGTGRKLPKYRNSEYERLKAQLNPNRVTDLKLHGDWIDGFRGIVKGDSITIGSSDPKSPMLHKKYGPDITNLTPENLSVYSQDYVLPELQDLTRKAL